MFCAHLYFRFIRFAFLQDSGLATQSSDYHQATPFCFTAQAKVPMAQSFQVKLSGAWTDYSNDEDKILKRAYLAGFENAKYSLRGQKYECNFKAMTQKNLQSGKVREMRPPHKWKAPPSFARCRRCLGRSWECWRFRNGPFLNHLPCTVRKLFIVLFLLSVFT